MPPTPEQTKPAAQLFTLERVSLDLGMPSVVLSGAQTYTRGDALGSELSAVKHVNILPCFLLQLFKSLPSSFTLCFKKFPSVLILPKPLSSASVEAPHPLFQPSPMLNLYPLTFPGLGLLLHPLSS